MTTRQTAALTWAALFTLGLALGNLISTPSPKQAKAIVDEYAQESLDKIDELEIVKSSADQGIEEIRTELDELGFTLE